MKRPTIAVLAALGDAHANPRELAAKLARAMVLSPLPHTPLARSYPQVLARKSWPPRRR